MRIVTCMLAASFAVMVSLLMTTPPVRAATYSATSEVALSSDAKQWVEWMRANGQLASGQIPFDLADNAGAVYCDVRGYKDGAAPPRMHVEAVDFLDGGRVHQAEDEIMYANFFLGPVAPAQIGANLTCRARLHFYDAGSETVSEPIGSAITIASSPVDLAMQIELEKVRRAGKDLPGSTTLREGDVATYNIRTVRLNAPPFKPVVGFAGSGLRGFTIGNIAPVGGRVLSISPWGGESSFHMKCKLSERRCISTSGAPSVPSISDTSEFYGHTTITVEVLVLPSTSMYGPRNLVPVRQPHSNKLPSTRPGLIARPRPRAAPVRWDSIRVVPGPGYVEMNPANNGLNNSRVVQSAWTAKPSRLIQIFPSSRTKGGRSGVWERTTLGTGTWVTTKNETWKYDLGTLGQVETGDCDGNSINLSTWITAPGPKVRSVELMYTLEQYSEVTNAITGVTTPAHWHNAGRFGLYTKKTTLNSGSPGAIRVPAPDWSFGSPSTHGTQIRMKVGVKFQGGRNWWLIGRKTSYESVYYTQPCTMDWVNS